MTAWCRSLNAVSARRRGSTCSKQPNKSVESAEELRVSSRSSRPASAASNRRLAVLPDAGGPTNNAGHDSSTHVANCCSGGSSDGRTATGTRGPAADATTAAAAATPDRDGDAHLGTAADPTTTAVGVTCRRGGSAAAGMHPNTSLKRRARCTRSAAVRMRCVYSMCMVWSTGGRSVLDPECRCSVSSHHRNTSRRLNSHGDPLRPYVPRSVSACTALLNAIMRSRRLGEEALSTASTSASGSMSMSAAVLSPSSSAAVSSHGTPASAGYMARQMKRRSVSDSGSTNTFVKRFRNDLGSPLRPPPWLYGFCAANTRNDGGHSKDRSISGMYTTPRWSKHAFRPSSTDWDARLSSSSNTQSPARNASKNTPSHHRNWGPSAAPLASGALTGKSDPNKSAMSVCSDKLMRTRRCPDALANALIKLVLPTPGLPSSNTGWGSCSARNTRMRLRLVVGAVMANGTDAGTACGPTGVKNGGTPKQPSSVTGRAPAVSRCWRSVATCVTTSVRWAGGTCCMMTSYAAARMAVTSLRDSPVPSPRPSSSTMAAPCTNAAHGSTPDDAMVAAMNRAHDCTSRSVKGSTRGPPVWGAAAAAAGRFNDPDAAWAWNHDTNCKMGW